MTPRRPAACSAAGAKGPFQWFSFLLQVPGPDQPAKHVDPPEFFLWRRAGPQDDVLRPRDRSKLAASIVPRWVVSLWVPEVAPVVGVCPFLVQEDPVDVERAADLHRDE